jgi:hypothetical protein
VSPSRQPWTEPGRSTAQGWVRATLHPLPRSERILTLFAKWSLRKYAAFGSGLERRCFRWVGSSLTFGWLTCVGSCGLCSVALFDLVEECVEVAAGELPFERSCVSRRGRHAARRASLNRRPQRSEGVEAAARPAAGDRGGVPRPSLQGATPTAGAVVGRREGLVAAVTPRRDRPAAIVRRPPCTSLKSRPRAAGTRATLRPGTGHAAFSFTVGGAGGSATQVARLYPSCLGNCEYSELFLRFPTKGAAAAEPGMQPPPRPPRRARPRVVGTSATRASAGPGPHAQTRRRRADGRSVEPP